MTNRANRPFLNKKEKEKKVWESPFDREVNRPQFNQKAGRTCIYFISLYILPHRIDITENKRKSITKIAGQEKLQK